MKFVDIKNDIAFRKIFGNENRKEILISFLNAVLLLENEKKIIDVEILTPYQLPDLKGGKVTILDIKAKDQNSKSYIVEMQVAEIDGFDKRVLYYASKSYSSQIERGDLFDKLNPTFFIGILDFEATKNQDYISRHKIIDIQTGENFIKDIEFNFIELPKFNKKPTELTTIIEQWVYFIKNADSLDLIPENIMDHGLIYAYEDAAKHNWTKEELDAYDYVWMREQDERGRISFAIRTGIEKGIKKEVDKIIEKEVKKALATEVKKALAIEVEKEVKKALAIEVEKEIAKQKNEFALKLISKGLSNKEIAQLSGLSENIIEQIRTNN